MQSPPDLTILFTDIESSTRLWEQHPELMAEAVATHDKMLRGAVESHSGRVVKSTGDGIFATFESPLCALGAAIEIQRALGDAASSGVALRVRCGIHVGAVQLRGGDAFGAAVNKAARIMSLAHPGQVLVSQAVEALVPQTPNNSVALRKVGTVRLKGIAAAERIYQVLHPSIPDRFPVLRSQERAPTNLPEPTTRLVGRSKERSVAKALLRKHRLVTLTGIGGIGKTRLALEVAREVSEQYLDGVWWVELAPIASPENVAQAIASVLALKEEPGVPLIDSVVRHLADRACLMILDNCEHLIRACTDFSESLLSIAAKAKVLATSREPLHITGECVLAVPPLVTPTERQALKELSKSAAVRLFVDRAKAARPSFRLSQHNARAVGAICRQVDGLPLALELAAAQIRALSEWEIARQFSERLLAQSAPGPTTAARQRTLRAMMDWSYDLLQNEEQPLFRRLAVFSGTFSLRAATEVCAERNDPKFLQRFMQLVDKSLVVSHPEDERYSMLQPVREYSFERLTHEGEVEEVRSRHLAFFLTLAEKARPELLGAAQAERLRLLDFEQANVVAAFNSAAEESVPCEFGLRLVIALDKYWTIRGLLRLGYGLAIGVLNTPRMRDATRLRSGALLATAWMACIMGRYAEALVFLNESLAISRALGDVENAMNALQGLAMAALGLGDSAAAREHCEEALGAARSAGTERRVMGTLAVLTEVLRVQGDSAAAERSCQEALKLARDNSENEATAVSLLNLASLAMLREDADQARDLLNEALVIVKEHGLVRAGQLALDVCAAWAAGQGKPKEAIKWYGASSALADKLGVQRAPADEAFLNPRVARARAELGEEVYTAALADGRLIDDDEIFAVASEWLNGPRGARQSTVAPQ